MSLEPPDREPFDRRLVTISPLPTPTLPGPIVDLRPITVDDAMAMFLSLSDEESNRLTGTQTSFTLEQVEAHCARIAAAEDLSDVYAAKLMRQLRLAGLVESVRGASGGYRLTRDAAAITVWDAIHALDDSYLPGAACDCDPADRIDCRRTTACAVTSLWRRVGGEIRASLEAVTLAELCGGALEHPERVELPVA